MNSHQYNEFLFGHEVITHTPDARMAARADRRISQAVERHFREQNQSGMLEVYHWEFRLINDPSANARAMTYYIQKE